jgi:hypothetical protein
MVILQKVSIPKAISMTINHPGGLMSNTVIKEWKGDLVVNLEPP